ncbi:hypothetical protein DVA78_17650, partial [Acinetobacter baumannii]
GRPLNKAKEDSRAGPNVVVNTTGADKTPGREEDKKTESDPKELVAERLPSTMRLHDLIGKEQLCSSGLIKTVGNDYFALSEQIRCMPLIQLKNRKAAYFCLDFPMVYFHDKVSYPTFEATGEI